MLKLFFRNTSEAFTAKQVATRIQESPAVVKKEIANLLEINLIKIKRGGDYEK
jgi:hypothetical protein